MKKKILLLAALAGLNTQAQGLNEILGDDFRVDYYGEVNGNANIHENYNYNYTYGWLSLGVEWKNKVRAVLGTSLTALVENGDIKLEDGFDIEEFITEAYIEIKDVGGQPVAFIIGKRSVPFATSVEAMPIFGNNPMSEMYDKDGVFGFTVRLNQGLFGLFDSAELSAFETEGDDLSIGTINGASVKLTKELSQAIAINAGYAQMDNGAGGVEKRASVGLISKTMDGDLVGWVNGMLFSDNVEYPNSDFAITGGVKYQLTRTADVVVEMTYVEKELMQYSLGVNIALTRRVTLGAEVRYNDYEDAREDEVVFGLNARYTFGVNNYGPNEENLFDGDF